MHLAAALQDIHALLLRLNRVSVKIRRALFELGEILDRFQGSLRAKQTLDVDATETGSIDAVAILIRSDVAHGVRGRVRMPIRVTIKTGHTQVRLKCTPVISCIELGLRE